MDQLKQLDQRKSIIEELISVSQKTAKFMRKRKETDHLVLENTMKYKRCKKEYKLTTNKAKKFNQDLENSENTNPIPTIYIPPFKDLTAYIYRKHFEKIVFQRSIYDGYLRDKGLDQHTLQI